MTTTADGPPRGRPRRDAGTVTAEIALVLPAVVVALLVALAVLAGGVTRLQCTDAARAATRAAALGESRGEVAAVGRASMPEAGVSISDDGAWVSVSVTCPVDLALFTGPWSVTATFETPSEPAGSPPPGSSPAPGS